MKEHRSSGKYKAGPTAVAGEKAYMQTIIEDQETANEKLQSANEEIQSTNEELITVNEELEHRHNELTMLYNDFVSLINSADLPLIVVGEDEKVRCRIEARGGGGRKRWSITGGSARRA